VNGGNGVSIAWITAVLGALCAAAVTIPWWAKRGSLSQTDGDWAGALSGRDIVYAGLADLEYDRQMGKIDEAAYIRAKVELDASLAEAEAAERAVRQALGERWEREMAARLRQADGRGGGNGE
jgi:Arc/MetJ family transcription regulator